MPSTLGYLAVGDERALIHEWFDSQTVPFHRAATSVGHNLFFEHEGPITFWPDKIDIDPSASPAVQKQAVLASLRQKENPQIPIIKWEETPAVGIVEPILIRNLFWTVGEISFTASRLQKRFPRLAKLNRELRTWLSGFCHVYGPDFREPPWAYFLEGGILNRDLDIFALPEAEAALKAGQYFVPRAISEGRLFTICQYLRLRGVEVSEQ